MYLQLYLHFPFCKRKCFYCDFCSSAQPAQTVQAYCNALEKEIALMGRKYADFEVSTVFLGGGTPSLVPAGLMAGVLDTLQKSFRILPTAEFTSEANPGAVTREWLEMAAAHGLNRLSLGVQAAQDGLLQSIGRIHTWADAEAAVRMARSSGIRNLNLDAMFGLPNQTEKDYLDTLAAFRDLGAEHISAYSLILEEGTTLHRMVEEGSVLLPDEDDTAAMYESGINWLAKNGYERYEVSNFAKPGFECRHNLGYWQGEWYLGMGVAAHSMLPSEREGAFCLRKGNGTDVPAYIQALNEGRGAPADSIDWISPKEAMFETMMLGLRTTIGVDAKVFERRYGQSLQTRWGNELNKLEREKLACWKENRFVLTPRGLAVQNEVLLRLMDEEEEA